MEQIDQDYIPMSDRHTFIYRNHQYTWINPDLNRCPECKSTHWNFDTTFRFMKCRICSAVFDRLEVRRRGVKA